MFTIIGYVGDTNIQHLINVAVSGGAHFAFLELTGYYATGATLFPSRGGDGPIVAVKKSRLDLGKCSGVYVRLLQPSGSNGFGKRARNRIARLVALREALQHLGVPVINPPGNGWENNSKPLQAALLSVAGFTIPPLVSTSIQNTLEEFAQKHQSVVFKSNSGIRSVVQDLNTVRRECWPRVTECPVLFQKRIQGADVRVHTVDDEVFGVRILSDVVDYRYAARQHGSARMEPADVPQEVASRCVSYAQSCGLIVAGFDFKVDASGRWYCLEMNPSPAFESFDHVLGGSIARRTIEILHDRGTGSSEIQRLTRTTSLGGTYSR